MKPKSLSERVENLLRERQPDELGGPGIQVAVVDSRTGQVVYEGAVGLANPVVDDCEKVTTRHLANLYSCSKFVTACGILQLIGHRQLSKDDLIFDQLLPPELNARILQPLDHPNTRRTRDHVTIEHVVAHISGAHNPLPLSWAHLMGEEPIMNELERLVSVFGGGDGGDENKKNGDHINPFRRGSVPQTFAYSNPGYWLLGPVILKAYNKEFPNDRLVKIFHEHLQLPASISDTFEIDINNDDDETTDKSSIGPKIMYGHVPRWSLLEVVAKLACPKGLIGSHYNSKLARTESHLIEGVSYGGLVGCSHDMALWLGKLIGNDDIIPNHEVREMMFTPILASGGAMTFGLHIRKHRGLPVYHKEGGGPGCHSSIQLRPHTSGLVACMISGDATLDVNTLLDDVVDEVEDWQHDERADLIECSQKTVSSKDGTRIQVYHYEAKVPIYSKREYILDTSDSGTIMLIHGGPGVPDYLGELSLLLIDHGITRSVVSFDQRGVGQSSWAISTNMNSFLEDIETIREEFGLKKLHIVGHSWGGVLARFYAQSHPERISSLLLLSPTTVHEGSDWPNMEQQVMQFNLRQAGWYRFTLLGLYSLFINVPFFKRWAGRGLMSQVMKNYYFDPLTAPDPSPLFLDGVNGSTMVAAKNAFMTEITSPLTLLPAGSSNKLNFKALAVFGENDIYGIDQVQRFRTELEKQGCPTVIMPQGSHIPWVDKPIPLVNLLRSHLWY